MNNRGNVLHIWTLLRTASTVGHPRPRHLFTHCLLVIVLRGSNFMTVSLAAAYALNVFPLPPV